MKRARVDFKFEDRHHPEKSKGASMKQTIVSVVFFIIAPALLNQTVFAWEENMPDIAIHGFISQGYMKATEDQDYMAYGAKEGTFQFNETGINFSTQVTDTLRIGAQFLAFDLGHLGNDEILVDWAYADFSYREYLGIRAGLMKIPYGIYNTTRDVDMLRTNIFLPAALYEEVYRDLVSRMKGVGVYGELPLGFSYQAAGGTVPFNIDGGFVNSFTDAIDVKPQSLRIGNTYTAGLQWFSPWNPFNLSSFRLASNYYITNDIEIDGTYLTENFFLYYTIEQMETVTGSMEIIYNDLILSSEFSRIYTGGDVASDLSVVYKISMTGLRYYFSASYRFTDWFQLGAFWSVSYLDEDDKNGKKRAEEGLASDQPSDGYQKDFCVSLRFDINDNWLLKLETHMMNGTHNVLGKPVNDEKRWLFNAVKLTYSF